MRTYAWRAYLAIGVAAWVLPATVRYLGCHLGQGYYFAKPLDENAVGALLLGQPLPRAQAATA